MEPTLFFRTSYFVFCSKRFANILYFIDINNLCITPIGGDFYANIVEHFQIITIFAYLLQ